MTATMVEHRVAPRRANVRGRGQHLTGGASMGKPTCEVCGEQFRSPQGLGSHRANYCGNTPERCSVDGCDRNRKSRGLCNTHYERLRLNGCVDDPTQTPFDRFVAQTHLDESGCWLWQGARDRHGYGYLSVDGSRVGAHRFAWTALVEQIPDGLVIDHLCRVPPCVNPDHLEPVTQAENIRRGVAGQRKADIAAQSHSCKRGHPWDTENTYIAPSGVRGCRACRRIYSRDYHQRHGSRT